MKKENHFQHEISKYTLSLKPMINVIAQYLNFLNWTQIFGDSTFTAMLLDRVTHNAHVINLTWESYRLKAILRIRRPPRAAERWESAKEGLIISPSAHNTLRTGP
jgi:hypothetical protein